MSEFAIIEVQPQHNAQLQSVIKSVLKEFNADRPGTAFQDDSLQNMAGNYKTEGQAYYIALDGDKVIGGAGIGRLENEPKGCELQKMYLLKDYRGKGIGEKLMKKCLEFAKDNGYHFCYLETFPSMRKAQILYLKNGFHYINKRLGNTCHMACDIFMIKPL